MYKNWLFQSYSPEKFPGLHFSCFKLHWNEVQWIGYCLH